MRFFGINTNQDDDMTVSTDVANKLNALTGMLCLVQDVSSFINQLMSLSVHFLLQLTAHGVGLVLLLYPFVISMLRIYSKRHLEQNSVIWWSNKNIVCRLKKLDTLSYPRPTNSEKYRGCT